jgi:hypothetical protein
MWLEGTSVKLDVIAGLTGISTLEIKIIGPDQPELAKNHTKMAYTL